MQILEKIRLVHGKDKFNSKGKPRRRRGKRFVPPPLGIMPFANKIGVTRQTYHRYVKQKYIPIAAFWDACNRIGAVVTSDKVTWRKYEWKLGGRNVDYDGGNTL